VRDGKRWRVGENGKGRTEKGVENLLIWKFGNASKPTYVLMYKAYVTMC
jgi:hypothetical protein